MARTYREVALVCQHLLTLDPKGPVATKRFRAHIRIGEILGKISDSIAARSSSRDRARNREQEEVDAAMRLL